jgi:surface carbohydrate biosynthesis protein (TIGR04326 family)
VGGLTARESPSLTLPERPPDSITLWDSSSDPSEQSGLVYRWNGYGEAGSIYSLLRYVERHGERLRPKYLALIHELGERRINGKRVIDHLALEDGLSYWWMTLLVEKSVYKSPSIVDAIRLLAIEEIVVQKGPRAFRLVSANRVLHEVLGGLCRRLGVVYEWKRLPNRSSRRPGFQSTYAALPQPVQALVSLALHLVRRWPLRKAKNPGWFDDEGSLFFCSYFLHLDREALANGNFLPQYWGGLPNMLAVKGHRTNWLHHYLESSVAPTAAVALDAVRSFNRDCQAQGFHSFLNAYLSLRVVPRVLRRWLKLWFISWRLIEIKHTLSPTGSKLSFWPLIQGDWHASMRGSVAIKNLLWIELFGRALRDLPRQQRGLFLCENQAWERAFIHAWHKHGHGQLIAVAHATIRFWDLRYFIDPRTVRSPHPYPMPRAELVALNGKAAVDAYVSSGYPTDAVVECEALRYGYLDDLRSSLAPRRPPGNAIKVLILGDYLPSCTMKMLSLLEAALALSTRPAEYTFKPHAGFSVKSTDFPSLRMRVVTDPLPTILRDFDVAYASNMTSAAVDAYLMGVPVIVMLDETELNFSPLRDRTGARFAGTPRELAEALERGGPAVARDAEVGDFFFLDSALPRWRRLLDIA